MSKQRIIHTKNVTIQNNLFTNAKVLISIRTLVLMKNLL